MAGLSLPVQLRPPNFKSVTRDILKWLKVKEMAEGLHVYLKALLECFLGCHVFVHAFLQLPEIILRMCLKSLSHNFNYLNTVTRLAYICRPLVLKKMHKDYLDRSKKPKPPKTLPSKSCFIRSVVFFGKIIRQVLSPQRGVIPRFLRKQHQFSVLLKFCTVNRHTSGANLEEC